MRTNPEMQENNEAGSFEKGYMTAGLWRSFSRWHGSHTELWSLSTQPGGTSQNPAWNEGIKCGVCVWGCNTLLAPPSTFKYVMGAILHLSAQVPQCCPLLEKWGKTPTSCQFQT